MKKTIRILVYLLLFCTLFTTFLSSDALAYYNRGKVALTIGTNNVSVSKGGNINVTISMNPASRTGIQGCGSPTCPQGCGGLCGDAVTGECHCDNDYEITKKAVAVVQSSNSMVATATYSQDSNVVTITGLNNGTAQIKVTGTLWQYTDSDPQIINVTVTGSSSSNTTSNSSSGSSQTPSSGSSSSASLDSSSTTSSATTATVANNASINASASTKAANSANNTANNAVAANNTATANNTASNSASNSADSSGTYTINGHLGEIDIITLGTAKTGKSEFEKIKGQNKKVTFQKMGDNGNVLYSWTFNGKDIKVPADINMTIDFPEISSAEASIIKNLKNPFYLSFVHSGSLPGKATIYTNVGSNYNNGDILSLYYYNKSTNKLELVASNLKVDGGYVSFGINHCSEYFLTAGIKKSSSAIWIVVCLVLILLITAAIAGYMFYKRKKAKEDMVDSL